jgi:hypothetical protein
MHKSIHEPANLPIRTELLGVRWAGATHHRRSVQGRGRFVRVTPGPRILCQCVSRRTRCRSDGRMCPLRQRLRGDLLDRSSVDESRVATDARHLPTLRGSLLCLRERMPQTRGRTLRPLRGSVRSIRRRVSQDGCGRRVTLLRVEWHARVGLPSHRRGSSGPGTCDIHRKLRRQQRLTSRNTGKYPYSLPIFRNRIEAVGLHWPYLPCDH